ncbi:MAG: M23 family metallopeptidase [Candidatus Heimdallarchaeota archaeon]|nr:M23 family metallopeptidase [Candidatus Heimdallarchaeota archaeon]
MNITYLPSAYLINGLRNLEDIKRVESNFFLRAVRIENNSSNRIQLNQYRFDIQRDSKTLKTIIYNEEMIKKKAEDVSNLIDALAHPDLAKFFLGTAEFWKKENLSLNELEQNQETGLRLEHFVYMDKEPVNQLKFTVFYTENYEEKIEEIVIPLKQYTSKNDYKFPLRGAWIPVNTSDNPYEHRRMHSQEFGFDLVKVDKDMNLSSNSGKKNEMFSYYGEEVIAIADGVIIDSFDQLPDNPAAGEFLPEEDLGKTINESGYLPVAAGNYIVIEHPGKEFSFYAHLIPNSLKVKNGEKIKQGQVIGFLGNSGNSTAPHLHFHLMQGPDPLAARGLPCKFSNLTGLEGEKVEFLNKNFSIVYTD